MWGSRRNLMHGCQYICVMYANKLLFMNSLFAYYLIRCSTGKWSRCVVVEKWKTSTSVPEGKHMTWTLSRVALILPTMILNVNICTTHIILYSVETSMLMCSGNTVSSTQVTIYIELAQSLPIWQVLDSVPIVSYLLQLMFWTVGCLKVDN